MGVLKLELPPQAEDGLARLAARAGISAEVVASAVIERFVAEELAIIEGIERGLDDVRHGRVVPHERIQTEVDRLLADAESDRQTAAAGPSPEAQGAPVHEHSTLVDRLLSKPPWDDDLVEVNRRHNVSGRQP